MHLCRTGLQATKQGEDDANLNATALGAVMTPSGYLWDFSKVTPKDCSEALGPEPCLVRCNSASKDLRLMFELVRNPVTWVA